MQNEDINIIVGSLDNYQLAFDRAEEKKDQIASYEKDIKDTYYQYFRLRGLDNKDIKELRVRLDKVRESRENIEKCNSELVAVGKQCSGIYKYFNNRGSDKTLLDGVPAEKKSKIIKSIDEYNSILAKAGEKYSRYDDFKKDVPAPEGWDKDYEDEYRKAKDNLDNMKESISRSGRKITR